MLLAYIDETGEPGAYVSPHHDRYKTSPAFGYAGFVIPETSVWDFASSFQRKKREVFASEVEGVENPGRWERKGASIFRQKTLLAHPQQFRVFVGLVKELRRRKGSLFYYADEKPLGTPKQTALDPDEREAGAMREALNRLARYADRQDENILVMIDQINEKTRVERVARMYGHVFNRVKDYPEMRRLVEPPMHIDSKLSASVQFADWVAAWVTRAIDYQLVRDSRHRWVVDAEPLNDLKGVFTYESKLHLHERTVEDINNSEILARFRPIYPVPHGNLIGASVDPDVARKMRGIAEASRRRRRQE